MNVQEINLSTHLCNEIDDYTLRKMGFPALQKTQGIIVRADIFATLEAHFHYRGFGALAHKTTLYAYI
jgi:hypothetical protein